MKGFASLLQADAQSSSRRQPTPKGLHTPVHCLHGNIPTTPTSNGMRTAKKETTSHTPLAPRRSAEVKTPGAGHFSCMHGIAPTSDSTSHALNKVPHTPLAPSHNLQGQPESSFQGQESGAGLLEAGGQGRRGSCAVRVPGLQLRAARLLFQVRCVLLPGEGSPRGFFFHCMEPWSRPLVCCKLETLLHAGCQCKESEPHLIRPSALGLGKQDLWCKVLSRV